MPVDSLVFAKGFEFSAFKDVYYGQFFKCLYKPRVYVIYICLYIVCILYNEFQVTAKQMIKVHFGIWKLY